MCGGLFLQLLGLLFEDGLHILFICRKSVAHHVFMFFMFISEIFIDSLFQFGHHLCVLGLSLRLCLGDPAAWDDELELILARKELLVGRPSLLDQISLYLF